MPEFCNPFTVLKNDRNLTHEELVRAIRFMIAAEYEAVQLYQQTAESTDNELAKEVLMDIANEEKEHAGEFLRLLRELDPEEEKFYKAEDFPIISISAKDKVRIHKLIHTALELKEKASRRVETSKLNKIIEVMQKSKRPPQMGEKLKVLYATQVDSNPPTFKMFVNKPTLFNRSIMRFLEKYIKRALELEGIPIVLKIDKKSKEQ